MDGISAMSAQVFAVNYDMAMLKKTIPAPPGGRRDAVCIFYTGSAHCSLVALDQTTRFRPKRLAS